MPIPQPNPLMFDQEPRHHENAPVNTDERSPQLDKVVNRCRCGCACSQSRGDDTSESDRSASLSPLRGRSPTVRDIISNHNPLESRPVPRASEVYIYAHHTSVQGQEGVAGYQLQEEIGDMGLHSRRDIDQILARHGHCTCPAPFNSPANSLIVETSSGEQSMASSGFLLPPTRSPSAVLGQIGRSFETDGQGMAAPQPRAQEVAIPPLWLNYERQFYRNLELGFGQGLQIHYPITLDIDEEEFAEFDMW